MGILAKIIGELGLQILTRKVVSEVFIYTANHFAKESINKLDDKLVKSLADALGVKVD